MDVRSIKLAVASGIETEEIISLNRFFKELFNDMKVYKDNESNNLTFMKDGKCLMRQNIENSYLDCDYSRIWSILLRRFNYTHYQIQEIILYKIEENFNIVVIEKPYYTFGFE